MKIYHNPRCAKSRLGLEYLKKKNVEFEVYDYLKNGLTRDDMKEILLKTNLKPIDLVRTQEEYFKKELKGKNFTDDEWVKIILENPKLLKRPIVVDRLKAVVAIPADNIDLLIR
ncbi:ArsC/Spx/MgsR family protein [uncultured Acetobacteroides sp.]|uniref:ArsC/Spx/MgsR family protein n=1 Tax=uncultured Acetobacteroides sp. TaxID=1760811 RepID=UPI0029F4D4B4|nr:ArsC/Spx/MgsR family protein [uncultured Acetobacteroides sp.]